MSLVWGSCLLTACFFPVQAERIMEALELFKEENRKMEEHKYVCEAAGKQVATPPRKQARFPAHPMLNVPP